MVTKTLLVLMVLVSTVASSSGTDSLTIKEIAARLAHVEAELDSFRHKNAAELDTLRNKNAELETRVAALEYENQRLKATSVVMEGDDHKPTKEKGFNAPAGDVVTKIGEMARHGKAAQVGIQRRVLMAADPTVAFTTTISTVRVSNLKPGQAILYDRIITNMGGAYQAAAGKFTAPVGGVYVFSVETMMEPGNNQYLELVHNGSEVVPIFTHGTGETRYESSCRIATLQVNLGDQVWVRVHNASWHGDGILHGNNFSSFSGWLVTIIE